MALYFNGRWGRAQVAIKCKKCKYKSHDLSIPCCPKCQSTEFGYYGFFMCTTIADKIVEMINGNEYYKSEVLTYLKNAHWKTCTEEHFYKGINSSNIRGRITRDVWPCKETNPDGTACIFAEGGIKTLKSQIALASHLRADHDGLTILERAKIAQNEKRRNITQKEKQKRMESFLNAGTDGLDFSLASMEEYYNAALQECHKKCNIQTRNLIDNTWYIGNLIKPDNIFEVIDPVLKKSHKTLIQSEEFMEDYHSIGSHQLTGYAPQRESHKTILQSLMALINHHGIERFPNSEIYLLINFTGISRDTVRYSDYLKVAAESTNITLYYLNCLKHESTPLRDNQLWNAFVGNVKVNGKSYKIFNLGHVTFINYPLLGRVLKGMVLYCKSLLSEQRLLNEAITIFDENTFWKSYINATDTSRKSGKTVYNQTVIDMMSIISHAAAQTFAKDDFKNDIPQNQIYKSKLGEIAIVTNNMCRRAFITARLPNQLLELIFKYKWPDSAEWLDVNKLIEKYHDYFYRYSVCIVCRPLDKFLATGDCKYSYVFSINMEGTYNDESGGGNFISTERTFPVHINLTKEIFPVAMNVQMMILPQLYKVDLDDIQQHNLNYPNLNSLFDDNQSPKNKNVYEVNSVEYKQQERLEYFNTQKKMSHNYAANVGTPNHDENKENK
eukprot:488726_1